MGEELRSILIGTSGLVAAALAAGLLAVTRDRITASHAERAASARSAGTAVLVQLVHFGEEVATGFHQRFPEQLGLAPWSPLFFVSFNLFWLVVWVLAWRGLRAGRTALVFALWLLGIAGVANALAHPLLAVRAGGYFPGLLTSPFIGVAGMLLLGRLVRVTRSPSA